MSTIKFSPFTSIFSNGAAGTNVIGSPGSGKTYFISAVISNALIMKQRVFALDPKNDLSDIQDYFNDLEVIDVNNIQPGSLNPFSVLKEVDSMIISSIISIICGGYTESQHDAITPIMSDFVTQYNRSTEEITMLQIAEYLHSHDNENLQRIGSKLMAAKETRYGPLLFADNVVGFDDNGREILAQKYQFTENSKIISLHGMNLPKSNSKDITDDQRFNSALVYIICRMIRELMMSDNYPTLFVLDEAHIAFGSSEFSNVVNDLLVLGRSLNVATLLASQSTSHYPDGIEQFIANSFMFKSAPSDAKKFLDKFTNQEGSNRNDMAAIVNSVDNFEPGYCFFVDRKNRTGIFKVTSPLKNMTSNPLSRNKRK